MRLLSTTLFLSICIISVNAQTNNSLSIYPEEGKPMPDFVLRNIEYYPKQQAALKDFQGKWLILDFWNKSCGACIASFPRTSEMQNKFQDKVQFMLVGFEDKENQIRSMYSKYRTKEKLSMPCAFDSSLCNRFDIYTAPHIIVIDDRGIVRAITNFISSKDITEFLAGKNPVLNKSYRFMHDTSIVSDGLIPYNGAKPMLINDNGGADTNFAFRSILAKWNPTLQQRSIPVSIEAYSKRIKRGYFQVLGAPLYLLYDYAYFGLGDPKGNMDDSAYGKYYDPPVLELHDSTEFEYSFDSSGKNLFSYSLIVPPAKAFDKTMQEAMRRDLQTFFGYEARIETRKCPYLRLVATEKAKKELRAAGDSSFLRGSHTGIVAKGIPVLRLLIAIRNENQGKVKILLDETAINGKIDINLNCIMTDLSDVKKALQKKGLDLTEGEKDMQVLVIRDKTPN